MNIAFIIYNGMTALDFVGVYDPLTRLKTMGFRDDLKWELCALTREVIDVTGLKFYPTQIANSLDVYDLIIVPGGQIARTLSHDRGFMDWLSTAHACQYKASVCTGALLLGAAGFLKGKIATTHPVAWSDLAQFCQVSEARIVEFDNTITARGVTAAIDLGLYLCEKFAGQSVKEQIRIQMDYKTEE